MASKYATFLKKTQAKEVIESRLPEGSPGVGDEDGKDLIYPQDLFDSTSNSNPPFVIFAFKDPIEKGLVKDYIVTYMPANLAVSYGAEWETEIFVTQRTKAMVSTSKSIIGEGVEKTTAKGTTGFIDSVVSGTLEAAAIIGDGTTVGREAQKHLGKTVNPHQALFFRNVNFREFKFDFRFMASSKAEAEVIREIIQKFKHAMHPGEVPGKTLLWSYPDNFEIFLFTPKGENAFGEDTMFKINTSVLESMEVNYAGSGVPAFFAETGHPVDIEMSLKFKEMEVLTKQKVEKGF
jgi:hypothetical protein